MNISNNYNKTIVILGPTGSGKTGVAIELAKRIGGEIISADSRAVYKKMDIGTAKPSMAEREGVPHFGFDLVEPGERFTAADFKQYALNKIMEIQSRGHVPIICGGTGLYVDSLIYDYKFNNDGVRSEQNSYHWKDNGGGAPDRGEVCSNYLLVGIKWESEVLRERLKKRIDLMFCEELFAETRELAKCFGWENQAMKSNIYSFVWQYLNGEMDLATAKERAFYDDWHLAKRQLTWFKRNDKIKWLSLENIIDYVLKCIQNEQRK